MVTEEIQRAILRLLVAGHTDDSIARRLGTSRRTVAGHVSRVSAALGSNGRAQRCAVTQLNLLEAADGLPDAWRSRVLGKVGTASVKVLRMDEMPVAEEVHATSEALVVLSGRLELGLDGGVMSLSAHDLCVVPAGTPHAVLPGSTGTLLIVEVDNEVDDEEIVSGKKTKRKKLAESGPEPPAHALLTQAVPQHAGRVTRYAPSIRKPQVSDSLTWGFSEPLSGFEPETYALRVRCSGHLS